MKRILLTFLVIFITANVSFCAPNYDPNVQRKVYSTEYNDNLLKRLSNDYHKKYTIKVNDNYYIDTSPPDAYHQEVIVPYFYQKQNKPVFIN